MKKLLNLQNCMLGFGLAFLYLPMLILIIYSFNESKLATVWGGFSVKWYFELMKDEQLLASIWMSLRIAFLSATSAVVLGTIASFVMIRFGRFRGHTLFSGLMTAPLVMPEVITGLSLLLLFVSMGDVLGWPSDRGIVTVWIAHTTFCTAFAAVVISSRMRDMDLSIEEAAQDLGSTPFKVFFVITVPVIAPALLAGFLMAFTLSLDDVVISSFVAGPGSTTMPMVVFSSARLGVSPKINALATIIIMTMSFLVCLTWWLASWRQKKEQELMNQLAKARNKT
ncbi:ABC transporter permease subunit [Amphritea sp. HPY]|uniref:ABC transporter permease subunit n=1 Tax=Amphritea sp. HPY TaxID=3421652 RepID=UPI003D7EDD95